MSLANQVRSTLTRALRRLRTEGVLGSVPAVAVASGNWTVERPKRPEHGDLATNIAMVLGKQFARPPRALAEQLVAALAGDDVVAKAEVAGPGFINLRLHPSAFHAELTEVLREGSAVGRTASGMGERINLEFVSANPTGPLLVSHGRGAIFGDAVGRLLEATGHRVTREYYINDFGNQVRLFCDSVLAVAEGRDVGEDGYKGAYVAELAAWLKKVDPEALKGEKADLARVCVTWMLRGIPKSKDLPGIRSTLDDLRVSMDVWFSEESLHRWGAVAVALRQLINVLGADHHGYVPRVRNALEALGLPGESFEALLFQLVFIYRDGQVVKSSKRAGNIITVEEVIEEIDEAAGRKGAGTDALRFFFLSRSAHSNVEFDIDLAKKKSLDNPVFYVQYGHARLCRLIERARGLGYAAPVEPDAATWAELKHPDELAIAARLSEFSGIVAEAANLREPHKVLFYVQDLARDFQSYYTRLKGENDPILPQKSDRDEAGWEGRWNHARTLSRLAWIEAVRTVYAAALGLLGISTPTQMERPADTLEAEEEVAAQ
jgi:arginyl-tRNA synthetase